ncbi:hypothetical protein VTN00DRAFT_8705 [Thermoascus crustaceus]|uniref:uncharacterized protein n=1 Tax=Thermoascus crustaceus TaxID=5088 RepID=UPI00374225A7
MSGKRLLDAIQFLNVAKSVAAKHLAVRQRQLDLYTRTSSLTKGIKDQADGLILTAQAAAALARRFNEPGQQQQQPTTTAAEKPLDQATVRSSSSGGSVQGVHDHLDVRQETVRGDPLPDGTLLPDDVPVASRDLSPEEAKKLQRQAESQIPGKSAEHSAGNEPSELNVSQGQEVFHKPSPDSPPVLSSLPRVKLPKFTGNVQEGSSEDGKINPDVYHSPVRSADGKQTVSEQQGEPSEEMMQNIFHSPRVARALSRKPPLNPYIDTRRSREPVGVAARRTSEESPVAASGQNGKEDMEKLGSSLAEETKAADQGDGKVKAVPYQMVESRVPSSRLGRLWQYGGLATSMALGAVGEGLRRVTGSGDSSGSIVFSAGNMERLVAKLSRMRGAALKLGQMLSFQDSKMLPDSIQQVLQRVQDRADYMPAYQRDKVLSQNLGPNWRDLFESFDEIPMAAASIGQVHGAVLKKNGQPVAVKIQYPGVAESIDSDLNNLSILLTASRLLPKGLYLDKTIANARTELAWECDYVREAEGANRFRQLLQDEDVFVVPEIIPEASGKQVLTMERMNGIPVTRVINDITQEQRDWIGSQILRLCFREIFEFRYMQTDPNWTNFLYNSKTNKIELLDFGASREYPEEFVSTYVKTLVAASRNDKEACRELSLKLGYLTGYETQTMVDAHVTSIITLAEPYMASSPDVYDFRDQTITDRVRALIPLMLHERLTPPPEETYSLHRKLSGAFLLCAKLGSRVRCKELFADAVARAKAKGLDVD